MKLNDLLKCSKPLFFDTRDEGWGYAFGGTCFIAAYRGSHFVITARHCVDNEGQWKPDQVRCGYSAAAGEFLPISKVYRIKLPAQPDAEKSFDVMFFKLDPELMTEAWLNELHPVDLGTRANLKPINFRPNQAGLTLRGYPTCLNQIKYEDRKLPAHSYSIDGYYVGPAPFRHGHLMKFHDPSKLSDHDGLSGSPVFLLTQNPGQTTYDYRFAGLHVRGSETPSLGCFIEAPVVLTALQQIHAGKLSLETAASSAHTPAQ